MLAHRAVWRCFAVVATLAAFTAIAVTAAALAWLTRLTLIALLAFSCDCLRCALGWCIAVVVQVAVWHLVCRYCGAFITALAPAVIAASTITAAFAVLLRAVLGW